MPTFSLPSAPRYLAVPLHCWTERSSTASALRRTLTASVTCFAPLNFRRTTPRPVSCYAFFKGWLLLSQPPGCRSNRTTFSTEQVFGTLANDLGSFPFDNGDSPSLSHSLHCKRLVFGVYQELVGREDPLFQTVALPPIVYEEAAPKGISRRTSYLRVR